MAAVLAIAGVAAAARGRTWLAAVAIGLAIASKQWAVIAVLPAVVAAKPPRSLLIIPVAGAIALAFLIPFMTGSATFGAAQHNVATSTGTIWRSHQVFWPLGVDAPKKVSKGGKAGPAWFGPIPRMLIVGLSLPLSLLWWRRRRQGKGEPDDVLLLLAVLFLFRAILDPWNIDYYHAPFLLALAGWETMRRRGGLPVLTLVATVCTWVSFVTWSPRYGDGTYLMYMSWTLPLAWYLLRNLLGPEPATAQISRRISTSANPSVSLP
jgi:hypothetical protein